MPLYRRVSHLVEATQWHPGEVVEGVIVPAPGDGDPHVLTLRGAIRVEPGDWIVTGPNGDRYPLPSDVFVESYVREGT